MNCPDCQFENLATARFCSNCGLALLQHCPNCQNEYAVGARFCMHCGYRLRAHTPADELRHDRLAAAAPPRLIQKARAASHLVGERRPVTVLFTDLVNSTGIVERIGEEAWREMLTGVFEQLAPIIYRYEGTIARIMGDAMVVFFGAPVAHEDDPVRAIWAGLDIIQKARQLADELRERLGIEFAMRACLNTGYLVVGAVGNNLKYEYTETEGVVHLAARLKFASEPMDILITESTQRFIAAMFEATSLGKVSIKGAEEVQVFRVLGPLSAQAGIGRWDGRGRTGLRSPLVGRDEELTALMQLTRAVQAGLGRAALISGAPGLGKTRLVMEWEQRAMATVTREHLSETTGLQWYSGHCYSFIQEQAYQLLVDLLRSILGLPFGASEPVTRTALYDLTRELFGEEYGFVYATLGHLFSIELESSMLETLPLEEPQALQNQYLAVMQQLLVRLAICSPMIIVLENIHWADPSSTAILGRLLLLALNEPILFCLVARPIREAPGWQLVEIAHETLGDNLLEIELKALSEAQSRALVQNLLDFNALPEELRQSILRQTEGNPLYVEEVIRMLIDHQVIRKNSSGQWVAGEAISQVTIPDNLQGLLQRRIDLLPEEVRFTLRVASVVGRRFQVSVLSEVLDIEMSDLGTDRSALMRTLNALEAAGLIRMLEVEPDIVYIHQHTLIRDAAYTSLLDEDRRRLHRIVGEVMERRFAGRLDEAASRLALHFREAGDPTRARQYFQMAGEKSMISFANAEAEAHFRKGLALAETDADRASFLVALGRALSRQSRYQEAIQEWLQAVEIYAAQGDLDNLARQYSHIARNASSAGDYPGCLEYCKQGLSQVQQSSLQVPSGNELLKTAKMDIPENHGVAALLHETARAYHFNGYPDEARSLCERALEMATRLRAVDIQADALATYGILPNLTAEVSLAALEWAIDLTEANGLMRIGARAHQNYAAMLRSYRNDHLTARKHYLRAAELHRQRGVTAEEILALGGVTDLNLNSGNLKDAEETQKTLITLVNSGKSSEASAIIVDIYQATLSMFMGEWLEALRLFRKMRDVTRRRGDLQSLVNINSSLGLTLLELGRWEKLEAWDETETAFKEALEISELGLASPRQIRYYLAMVLAARGNAQEGRRMIKLAMASTPQSDGGENQGERGFNHWATANVAVAEQRWSEAFSNFEQAADLFNKIGLRWLWARTLLDWAEALLHTQEPSTMNRARVFFQQLESAYQEMGATGYLALVRKRLEHISTESLARVAVYQRNAQELQAAGRIQEGLYPEELPRLPGWQIAVRLEAARETSGDFYDFIPLPDGRFGFAVADVTDKGMGAALFMALTRTLLRTFAQDHPEAPEQVLAAVNRRMLADTSSRLFVTMFYGVLDPQDGQFVYCNAGHNPPLLFKQQEEEPLELVRTGVPLGMFDEATWDKKAARLNCGDCLTIFSDGVTEATDEAGDLFGDARLLEAIKNHRTQPDPQAEGFIDAILDEVAKFIGEAPRSDDITLMVLKRVDEIIR